MRLKNLAAAVAILLPVVGVGGTALAGDGGGWKKIPISFTTVQGTATDLGSVCNSTNQCVYLATGNDAAFVGDLQGQGVTSGVSYTANVDNVLLLSYISIFTGTVKGCGTGSLTYSGTSTVNFNTGELIGNWTVAPGFGTGDLVGITGSVHQHNDQPAVGWVRCKVKRNH